MSRCKKCTSAEGEIYLNCKIRRLTSILLSTICLMQTKTEIRNEKLPKAADGRGRTQKARRKGKNKTGGIIGGKKE